MKASVSATCYKITIAKARFAVCVECLVKRVRNAGNRQHCFEKWRRQFHSAKRFYRTSLSVPASKTGFQLQESGEVKFTIRPSQLPLHSEGKRTILFSIMAKYTSDGAGNLQCCSNMAIKQSGVTTCQGSPDRLEYTHTHTYTGTKCRRKKKNSNGPQL